MEHTFSSVLSIRRTIAMFSFDSAEMTEEFPLQNGIRAVNLVLATGMIICGFAMLFRV
jgi:hypothetical protein